MGRKGKNKLDSIEGPRETGLGKIYLGKQIRCCRTGTVSIRAATDSSAFRPPSPNADSTEILPASPVLKSAASPELPPRYEESVSSAPAPIPTPKSPLEIKREELLAQLKQLQDMGFQLTLEQLKEKLQQHSGNMDHVVNSLLRY